MKVAWATDIHLEFLTPPALAQFVVGLARSPAEAFLLGGDISQSSTVLPHLRILERSLDRPIYFVLGNHDYYGAGIGHVRAQVRTATRDSRRLHWLTGEGVIRLSRETALIGHDGWADGRNGNYAESPVMLNDYRLIADFAGLDSRDRLRRLGELAEEAANHVREHLSTALDQCPRGVFLTHVPPFAEAAWHRGRMSDDDWLPHFSNRVVGEELLRVMKSRPDRELLVLCGHTHSPGEFRPLPNLRVVTGGARYGEPEVTALLDL